MSVSLYTYPQTHSVENPDHPAEQAVRLLQLFFEFQSRATVEVSYGPLESELGLRALVHLGAILKRFSTGFWSEASLGNPDAIRSASACAVSAISRVTIPRAWVSADGSAAAPYWMQFCDEMARHARMHATYGEPSAASMRHR